MCSTRWLPDKDQHTNKSIKRSWCNNSSHAALLDGNECKWQQLNVRDKWKMCKWNIQYIATKFILYYWWVFNAQTSQEKLCGSSVKERAQVQWGIVLPYPIQHRQIDRYFIDHKTCWVNKMICITLNGQIMCSFHRINYLCVMQNHLEIKTRHLTPFQIQHRVNVHYWALLNSTSHDYISSILIVLYSWFITHSNYWHTDAFENQHMPKT